MEYNQNDVAKFVPLDQHKGRDVIMVARRYDHSGRDKAEAFEQAKANFFKRVEGI